jgi:catechol 2,3-dioxygenase-like lactoylglutathione lyase family enzyme
VIAYVTLGTNNVERAARFYDALLAEFGAKRYIETNRGISWSVSPDKTDLAVMKPFDGQPATVGNGFMVAVGAANREVVDTLYRKAIELGATGEGRPGPCGPGGFCAGYFRDLDGNKINVFCTERNSQRRSRVA